MSEHFPVRSFAPGASPEDIRSLLTQPQSLTRGHLDGHMAVLVGSHRYVPLDWVEDVIAGCERPPLEPGSLLNVVEAFASNDDIPSDLLRRLRAAHASDGALDWMFAANRNGTSPGLVDDILTTLTTKTWNDGGGVAYTLLKNPTITAEQGREVLRYAARCAADESPRSSAAAFLLYAYEYPLAVGWFDEHLTTTVLMYAAAS